MSQIVEYKSVSIDKLMANIEHYKNNPSSIREAAFDYLEEITSGQVDIVDPTNPFVFLLGVTAANTAAAIQENFVNLRALYPSLAQELPDLYRHMSDKDYIDRFAVPTTAKITLIIGVSELMSQMAYDNLESCWKATIPRDTSFTVDGLTFTMSYPVDIRRFENGVVQVSYDSSVKNPHSVLTGSIIEYKVMQDQSGVSWMFMDVDTKQLSCTTTYYPLEAGSVFSRNIQYTNQFYYIRAFYRNASTQSKWKEIKTTHTDQVYDPTDPTAVIQVHEGYLNVSVPMVYMNTSLMSGEIRFDIYTTKGAITIDLSSYNANAYTVSLKAIDEERDLTPYTEAFARVSYHATSDKTISGGRDSVGFDDLRERVIFNSLGEQQLPITSVQIDTAIDNKGFDLIKNVDVLTNRIYLATKRLPNPINTKLLTAANIGISPYINTLTNLSHYEGVNEHAGRLTILSGNMFVNTNGIVRMLDKPELDSIYAMNRSAMITNINSNQYLYNPFYYILDNTRDEFEVRVYSLDRPSTSSLSFHSQNQSLQLVVNTGQYSLERVPQGYKLTITTRSGNNYKQIPDGEIYVQLAFYPEGEVNLAYINGTQIDTTDSGERVFEFILETTFDIDSEHRLAIYNAKMFTNESLTVWLNLETQFHLVHSTTALTSQYVPDVTDTYVGKFLLPANVAGNARETLDVEFGKYLRNLWVRSRSIATGLEYQRYEEDIPLLYDRVVYRTDPVTGSIFYVDNGELKYEILHNVGDIVLSDTNEVIYKHRAGDVVLVDNEPVIITGPDVNKEIDIFFIDGRYYFADDDANVRYRDEVVSILETWINDELADIQLRLLEQTYIYFYPKTTLGMVKIYTENGGEDYIPSEQSLKVKLYVRPGVYNNDSLRKILRNKTIEILDTYISETIVNVTEILSVLKEAYGDSVLSVSLSGIGGTRDYQVITVASEHNKLCLKKIISSQLDNTLIVEDDVSIEFFRIDN